MVERQTLSGKPEPRDVYLRNDAPGIHIVHDSDLVAHELKPGGTKRLLLDLSVCDMIEREIDLQQKRGNHNVLRIVDRSEAQAAREGRGPPVVPIRRTGEQEAMLELAKQADGMNFREFSNTAREMLGDKWPGGRPSRDAIITALERHGQE